MSFGGSRFIFVIALVAWAGPCWFAPSLRADENSDTITALIKRLDADSFRDREEASRALFSIGEGALPQLRNATATGLEKQNRLVSLIRKIEDEQFSRLSKSFLAAEDHSASPVLPAWKYYAEFAGETRISRLFFLEMFREHPDVSRLIDVCHGGDNADQQKELRRVTTDLTTQLMEDRVIRLQIPKIGDVLTVLLATTCLEGPAPTEVNRFLETCSHSVPVTTHIRRKGHDKILQSLYAAWIPKTSPDMATEAIFISLQYGFETGAVVARKQLDAHLDAFSRSVAIQCLARFGDQRDLSLLLPLLEDETVCGEFQVSSLPVFMRGIQESDEAPPGTQERNKLSEATRLQFRICDVALAASLMLADFDVREAFPAFAEHSKYAFDMQSVAVGKDEKSLEARSKLIADWRVKLVAKLDQGDSQ